MFEAAALSIPDSSDPELLHTLIWGLHDRIRQEARFRDPETIMYTARIALEVEKQLY